MPAIEGKNCFRGQHEFMGFVKEERKTRKVLDEHGWQQFTLEMHVSECRRIFK